MAFRLPQNTSVSSATTDVSVDGKLTKNGASDCSESPDLDPSKEPNWTPNAGPKQCPRNRVDGAGGQSFVISIASGSASLSVLQ